MKNVSMNPFRYGCVVKGSFFCPRPLLERELARFIERGQNVVVYGERRMGKTSLVYETVRKMRGRRLLYVDLMGIGDVAGFCRRVLTGIRDLDGRLGLLKKALSLIPRLRPLLSIDPVTGGTSFSLDARMASDPSAVEDVVAMLAATARKNGLVIVFDEFQGLLEISGCNEVLALLRSRIQFQDDVPYVFTGSVRHKMMDLFDSPSSPFYKSALSLCVGEIDVDDFARFIKTRFQAGGRRVDETLVRKAIEVASNVPGDVQELCDALWETTSDARPIEASDISRALQLVYVREGEKFETWYAALSPGQSRMLSGIARFGGANVQSKDFLCKAGVMNAATARKAVMKLVDSGLLYRFRSEYRFTSTFFRNWLLERDY